MTPLNMTPLRLSVLRFLSERERYNVKGLVHELCPRTSIGGNALHWTEQGAARMAGKLIKPLVDAGLVKSDSMSRMYKRDARITEAGRAVLAAHDEAFSRTALVAAIESGE